MADLACRNLPASTNLTGASSRAEPFRSAEEAWFWTMGGARRPSRRLSVTRQAKQGRSAMRAR